MFPSVPKVTEWTLRIDTGTTPVRSRVIDTHLFGIRSAERVSS